jgi:uncharacterized membrane protein (UPF0127 family)
MRKILNQYGSFTAIFFLFLSACGYYSYPQQLLPQKSIKVGDKPLFVEVASTPQQIELGLMGRKELSEGNGMIFIFPDPRRVGFWMKNTSIPLSVAYIDNNLSIREIYDMQPYSTELIVSENSDIKYVLEVPQGWFTRNNLGINHKITFL